MFYVYVQMPPTSEFPDGYRVARGLFATRAEAEQEQSRLVHQEHVFGRIREIPDPTTKN
jgi:hypothetical protein